MTTALTIEEIDISEVDDRVLKDRLQELQDEINQEKENKRKIISDLGAIVAKRRDEAVKARRASGIETQWREDEEYIEGIDDLNRGEAQYMKSRSTEGGIVTKHVSTSDNECIEFLNITRPFVDAAEARMVDMVRDFEVIPTPMPEIDEQKDNNTPMILQENGEPFTVADAVDEVTKKAYAIAGKAEKRIRDYLSECKFDREQRKAMSAAVSVGTGILEGPVPAWQAIKRVVDGELVIEQKIVPVTKYLDHWDAFPDMNCGEDIQDGEYFIKREYLTARQLRGLRGLPGYDDESIDKVLDEGPGKRNVTGNSRKDVEDDERFEVWYYHGDIKPDELSALDENYECGCDDERRDPVAAVVVMVNDTPIKAYKDPLEHYGYPYDFFVWQRVPGCPFGIGVARQGRTPQKTVLAAFRTLMKNQGLAASPMVALMRSALEPADGSWEMTPGKQWLIREDTVKSAQEAIQTITIPSLQAELNELIQLGMKSMEDSTGITFLMQGQQGAAPDTVGGMQMMLQSSSSVLRLRVTYFDQTKIEHIKRYYGWLLMYGEDDEKGDVIIDVKGSSSVAEKEIKAMQLPSILQLAANPAFGKSAPKVFDEWLESLKFSPGKFDMTEEEKQQMMQQQQQSADPRIEVAKMNAEKDLQIAAARKQTEELRIKKDIDRDMLYARGVAERTQNDRAAHIEELQLKHDLAILEYANREKTNIDSIKAKLADSAMKLAVTKELAGIKAPASALPTPPVEPPQQAPEGESFQQ